MPVHLETTSAISSSVTLLRTSWVGFCSAACAAASFFSSSGILPYCSSAIFVRSFARRAVSRSSLRFSSSSFADAAPCSDGLLGLPDFLEVRVFLLQAAQRFLERLEALLRGLVILLLQRHLFDAQLDDAPLELVHLLGLGVDLHADARAGLVDQVDGLVRQLAVGDVAMRQLRGGHDGRIGDLDAVVHFVALLQAAQDRDGVFDGGLVHQHLLEAPLQGGILLDVLAVFVQRGGAHAVQLAARQRGLEHVAGVHRALGLAGAHHGVQLVDEQDDLAFLLGKVLQHGLEPFLEFAAELRAGDQRAHVQREDLLVLEALRHFAVDDALRQPLDNGRLAHARLADEHRIVLGASLQHLHGAADLVVAADDRVELAGGGALGEVDGVFRQRLAALLGVGIIHRFTATHFGDGRVELRLREACALEQAPEFAAVIEGRQREQFAGDVLVAALLRQLVGDVEGPGQILRYMHFARRALHFRKSVQQCGEVGLYLCDIGAGLGEQWPQRTALLIQECEQHMCRFQQLVITADGQGLGVRQGGLESAGQLVVAHGRYSGVAGAGIKGLPR